MSAIPLDVMLWLSGGVWMLGALALIPCWWRGRLRRAGKLGAYTDEDVFWRDVSCGLLTLGTISAITASLTAASRSMSFGAFAVVGAAWAALLLLIAYTVDARARRHR